MLDLTWHRRTVDIPDAVWAECFPVPHEGLFWFRALEASGIEDQFTFFFALLRDGGAPVGVVPAFVFDLPLELVLPDAAARIASLAGRSPLRRLVRVRTFFIGSVAGEEGHVGLHPGYILREVATLVHAAARRQASDARAALLVWKDFPDSDREALDALAGATKAFRMPSYPGSSVPLLPGGYDAYLQTLPSRHRNKMRKRLRRGSASLPMTSSLVKHPSAAQVHEMFSLYTQTYGRGPTKFERLTPEFFAEIAKFDGAAFVVLQRRDSGRMVAFMLLFDLGERVINQFIGIDYAAAEGGFAYFRLFAAAYDWACTTGARTMQSGQTGYMAKLECGHSLVPLWNYCEHRNAAVNWVLRKAAGRITWGVLDDQLREWLIAHPDALPAHAASTPPIVSTP
jgi:hypothetical protein